MAVLWVFSVLYSLGDSRVILISGFPSGSGNEWYMNSCLYLPKKWFFSPRQGSSGGDKHYLYPPYIMEFGWLCPSRPLWASGVHSMYDPHSQSWCVPCHSVSGFLTPVDVGEKPLLLEIGPGCFGRFSGGSLWPLITVTSLKNFWDYVDRISANNYQGWCFGEVVEALTACYLKCLYWW